MTKREFSAPIEGMERGGAFVTIPFDVEAVFAEETRTGPRDD
jgi:hypothetical protein